MQVELTKEDLICLVKGTNGPGSYAHPFGYFGCITGFPNEEWIWDEASLNFMNEEELFRLYNQIKDFKCRFSNTVKP